MGSLSSMGEHGRAINKSDGRYTFKLAIWYLKTKKSSLGKAFRLLVEMITPLITEPSLWSQLWLLRPTSQQRRPWKQQQWPWQPGSCHHPGYLEWAPGPGFWLPPCPTSDRVSTWRLNQRMWALSISNQSFKTQTPHRWIWTGAACI